MTESDITILPDRSYGTVELSVSYEFVDEIGLKLTFYRVVATPAEGCVFDSFEWDLHSWTSYGDDDIDHRVRYQPDYDGYGGSDLLDGSTCLYPDVAPTYYYFEILNFKANFSGTPTPHDKGIIYDPASRQIVFSIVTRAPMYY